MNITEIIKNYDIGNIIEIEKLNRGNTATTYQVLSEKGKWIVRSLKNEEQGEAEYNVSEFFNENGSKIVPKILKANNGAKYINISENFYNVQAYVSGILPKINEFDTIYKLGILIAEYHKILRNYSTQIIQQDRFSIKTMWDNVKDNIWLECNIINNKLFDNLDNMNKRIQKCIDLEKFDEHIIHGDLGIWNMLQSDENIHIIDFGEIRRGHFYLDVAAVLSSEITIQDKDIAQKLFNCFLEGYSENIDKELLFNFIELWLLRGVLAVLNTKKNDNQIKYAEMYLNQIDCFRSFLL